MDSPAIKMGENGWKNLKKIFACGAHLWMDGLKTVHSLVWRHVLDSWLQEKNCCIKYVFFLRSTIDTYARAATCSARYAALCAPGRLARALLQKLGSPAIIVRCGKIIATKLVEVEVEVLEVKKKKKNSTPYNLSCA